MELTSVSGTGGMLTAFCSLLAIASAGVMLECNQPDTDETTIYDFSLMDVHKQRNISLSEYRGKVVLIVNVATYWGLTPHYYGVNALISKYGSQNFTAMGVPCNQFNLEEPGNNGTEIMNAIKYVRPGNGFVPNFQIFELVDVNGNNEHKLYTYLKSYCPPTVTEFDPTWLFYTPIKANDVAWNWETFLVGADGRVLNRAPPTTDPQSLEPDIEAALAKAHPVNNLLIG